MRSRVMILCILCLAAIYSSAQEKFSIRGIADEDLNDRLVYLCLLEDGENAKEFLLDSAIVKKGKFAFSGIHDMPHIAIIKDADGEAYPFILEKGKILVNIKAKERSGTPLNDTLDVALHRMQPIIDNMTKTATEMQKFTVNMIQQKESVDRLNIMNDTAFKAKFDRYSNEIRVQGDSISQCMDDYKNSIVGVSLFAYGGMILDVDDMETLMKEASPVFTQNALVKDIVEKKRKMRLRMEEVVERHMSKEKLEAQKEEQEMDARIKVGERFPDAKVKDNAGEMKLLSDYIGKGKYVLVDFWASWCGPCRHEMPNVKAAYEKYASKGFEVVSISTDRKLKPWRAAIEELGMDWTQLLDVDAADKYGVYSIPRTFLIDPTGIVIDKNLRGEKLGEALSKLFK